MPNGKDDFPAYARFLDAATKCFPVFVAVVGAVLWFGQRMESPEEKISRIKVYTNPLDREVERLIRKIEQIESQVDAHQSLGGHLTMEHRMQNIEKRVGRLEGNGND